MLPASKGSASGRSGPKLSKDPNSIEGRIQVQGKKYLMFYRLWVPEALFPLSRPQQNFDPHSHLRWASPQGKIDGARAELYGMLPQELHRAAETLATFPSLVRSCPYLHFITYHTSSVTLSIMSGQMSSM